MSAEEIHGDGSEWDLLVQRIREMPDETRDHAQVIAESAAFDRGWKAACEYLESDLRANKRAFGRRLEARIYREVRRQRRAARVQTALYAAIAGVLVAALLYLRSLA